jgi:uncharacterized repeat protein (TIGR03803 family)
MRHSRSSFARILGNAAVSLIAIALFVSTSPDARAQTTYAMTQGGVFGTLNLSTGAFNQISNPGFEPAGFGAVGTNLYAANYPGSTLYEINLSNGTFTTVGTGTASYYDFGSTATQLYATGTDTNLYSVNTSTGASTLIGPTGLGTGGYQTMSTGGTALYTTATPSGDSLLYSVNTTTGAATEIGDTGVINISGMGFADGQLYAGDESGNLYTINTNTGLATLITNNGLAMWGMGLPPLTLNTLHNFSKGSAGSNPFAGLTINTAGNILYGSTGAGGSGACSYDGLIGCGTLFKLNKKNSAWVFDPLYSFQGGTDGEFPARPVTIGPNSTLYGATLGGGEGTCVFDGDSGCGTVFNAGPGPTPPTTPLQKFNEKVLYRFTGAGDGGIAFTTLTFDAAGNLYGTTTSGGANNLGTVFKLTPSGGGNYTESVLYSFAGGNDAAGPSDGLTFDTAGNLYSTTAIGGGSANCSGGCGTVFELSPSGSGWTEKVIYKFQGPSDGENPDAGVVIDAAGNLYGNTYQGGPGGGGTVWELSPSGSNWNFTLLYRVPVSGYAVGRVARDSNGNLYQALQGGGTYNTGQVFELTPSNGNWLFTDLHDFTGGTDGANPIGGVVLDSSGNIYGTALFGGTNSNCGSGGTSGCGNVWEITP